MSQYIEDIVSSRLPYPGEIPKSRPYKSYPEKKTFTFSPEFVSSIKKYKNMSLLVEAILSDHLF